MEGFELYAIYMQAKQDQGGWFGGTQRWEHLTDANRRAWSQVGRRVDLVIETKVVEDETQERRQKFGDPHDYVGEP